MAWSNIFATGTAGIAELFEGYVDGASDGSAIALVLGKAAATPAERNAIERSLAALGYGKGTCTYATLFPHAAAAGGDALPETTGGAQGGAAQEQPEGPALDAQAMFLLVEGLDPLVVIATDAAATKALADAYRVEFSPDTAIRVFGRPAVAFANLNQLLATEAGKQKAWFLLKSIPKR